MDPLSVTASVVGITTAALQSVQSLATTISNIKGAPDTVKAITADLQAFQSVLQKLNGAIQNGSSQIILSSQVTAAVENCSATCVAFRSQMEHWMRHSTEDKTFWRDKWTIAFFGQDKIKTFKEQLNTCKSTLLVALSTETIFADIRQDYLTKEDRDEMLRDHESNVGRKIARADNEAAEIEKRRQQVAVHGSSGSSDGLEQSRQELLQELERQQATNAAFKDWCEEVIAKTEYERTGQKIKGVMATNYGTAVTGFYNASEQESKIDQDISDITADNWGIAVTGVARDVDFKSLRPNGSGGGGL